VVDISALQDTLKELCEKCEATGNVTFVIKAKYLFRAAEDQEKIVDVI